jgi:PAS domain S-box-containing protein
MQLHENAFLILDRVGLRPGVRAGSAPCDPVFSEFTTINPAFTNLALLDGNGRVECSAVPLRGTDVVFADSSWFRDMIAGRDVAVSQPLVGPLSGRWTVILARALREPDARLSHAVAVSVDLDRYQQILAHVGMPAGGAINVIDAQGRLVAHAPQNRGWIGRDVRGGEVDRLSRRRIDGYGIARGLDGIERIYGFTTVPGFEWKVMVGLPIASTLAPVRSEALRTGLIGLALFIVVAWLTFRLAERIARPFRQLARATENVMQGRFDSRVPTGGPREIAEVAERFNQMVDVRRRSEEERERAERALHESAQRLRLAVDASDIGLWDWDVVTGRTYLSPEWKRQLGYEDHEVPNASGEWRRRLHPDDAAAVMGRLERYLAHPDGDYQSEFRLRHRDGTWRWIWSRARLLFDGDGKPSRKRSEEEQARLQRELRQSAVMSAMGTLVAGVAHEVRNPLFGISATIDAFEARFGNQPEHQRYLQVLRQELDNLNRLMRDLLEYGRPVSPDFEPVDLEKAAQEAVRAGESLADQAGVRVEVESLPGVPRPWADASMVRQVLLNLVENAVQHSPRDAVVTVRLTRGPHEGDARVEVLDRGPGFRADDLPRVFDPFFSRREGGTGLGLSIVRRLVESFGGEVVAENRPEGGARVSLTLPVREGVVVR